MPGKQWFKNLAGLSQSDLELMMVPNPMTELTIHVTFKSVQMGTLLGTIIGPITHLIRHQGIDQDKAISSAANGGLYGAGCGFLMGPILTYLATKNLNDVQIYDR